MISIGVGLPLMTQSGHRQHSPLAVWLATEYHDLDGNIPLVTMHHIKPRSGSDSGG
jgi:hypothetical protein